MGLFENIKNRLLIFLYKFRKPMIHVYRAGLSGNGSFVDIRYWLSRPEIVNPNGAAYLVDNETGTKLHLMKIAKFGTIRIRHSKRKTTGILLFRNQDGLIKQGSMVSVCLDTLVVNNIEIQ